jgi:predicted ATPase
MKLTRFSVKNFRSLESVELTGLSQFNVLIGKNNSGKSSCFAAIRFLSDVIHGGAIWSWGDNILSKFSNHQSWEIELEFEVHPKDRQNIIPLLAREADVDEWLQSGCLRGVQFKFRSSPLDPKIVYPKETRVRGRKGSWMLYQTSPATLLRAENDKLPMQFTALPHSFNEFGGDGGNTATEDPTNTISEQHHRLVHWPITWAKEMRMDIDNWPFFLLSRFLSNSFFFDHFRRFDEQSNSGGNGKLNQDGRNLVQVLDYWGKNNRPLFNKIEGFIKRAFLGVGGLETPFTRPNEQIFHAAFRPDTSEHQIPLQHMGGGVAQLLMAAVALETTSSQFPIFIEEPETNLHPGAQRFLAERLCDENRQVFITTHSPTFINLQRSKSVHKISMAGGKTSAVSLDDNTLHSALGEIGARNSDVLLSDAVVFVEGESDLRVLQEWCKIEAIELTATNTTILVMHSFGRPELSVPIRSDTLKEIAINAHIPHIFVLDADELSDAVVKKLSKELRDRLYMFQRRELENYLLIPRALKAAIRHRLVEANLSVDTVDKTEEREIERMIKSAADKQKGRVLLKRIRAQLEPPQGGIFPRTLFVELEQCSTWKSLPDQLAKRLGKHYSDHLHGLNVKKLVDQTRKKLDREWKSPERRLEIAPGAELVEEVFRHFDLRYNKTTDGPRIAKQMTREDLDPEVRTLLQRIRNLIQSRLS